MPTTIEWTDETWNPVTGCSRVSPGCDNCYMFALYPRLHGMGVPGYSATPETVQIFPSRLDEPMRWTTPRMVFVNSMSDAFHRDVPFTFITEMFIRMRAAAELHGHIFQVLTKRPGRAAAWWNEYHETFGDHWPESVWLGTSVESQRYAPRIEVLSRVPAPIRFVSAEPLLGKVDLSPWLATGAVQWVIVGGESGMRARPLRTGWIRELRRQCSSSGTALFVKQLGSVWSREKYGKGDKGGDWSDWPKDLKVRQFPPLPNGASSRDGMEQKLTPLATMTGSEGRIAGRHALGSTPAYSHQAQAV